MLRGMENSPSHLAYVDVAMCLRRIYGEKRIIEFVSLFMKKTYYEYSGLILAISFSHFWSDGIRTCLNPL